MADITITCPGCGNRITVSEFVSAPSLVCAQCEVTVLVPKREPPAPGASGLRLAVGPPPESSPEPTPSLKSQTVRAGSRNPDPGLSPANTYSQLQTFLPSFKPRKSRRKTSPLWYMVWPWVLFMVLTTTLAWLRYWPGTLLKPQFDMVTLAGVWCLFALHVVIVLHAFNDDTFDGLLCALVPGYSLYYLFVQTDQYYLRALAASVLLVFGWDASLAIHRVGGVVYHGVSSWIQGNDTFTKNLPH